MLNVEDGVLLIDKGCMVTVGEIASEDGHCPAWHLLDVLLKGVGLDKVSLLQNEMILEGLG